MRLHSLSSEMAMTNNSLLKAAQAIALPLLSEGYSIATFFSYKNECLFILNHKNGNVIKVSGSGNSIFMYKNKKLIKHVQMR